MTNHQKIYFIIQQRKSVCLNDLYDITLWDKYTVLKSVAKLVMNRKIKAIVQDNTRYFVIKHKK